MAATYYIDSVTGDDSNIGTSESASWKSIAKVNGTVFGPGDEVLFRRGSMWTGRLTPKGSGTTSNRIRFGAYGTGAKPIINGGGATQAIALWDNEYITIENFEITNDAAAVSTRDGIRITAQDPGMRRGIWILNNDIHHVRGHSDRNSGLYNNAAIYIIIADNGSMSGFQDMLVEGNTIYDVTCIGLYVKPAIYYSAHPELWATNMTIRDNVFNGTGADHIVVAGAINPLIEYNACYDAGINGQGYGYIAGIWTWKCDGAVVQFNEVARTRNELALTNLGDSQAFDVDISNLGTHIFQYNYTHENVGGILLTMADSDPQPKTVIYRYNLSVNDGRDTNSGCQFNVNPSVANQTVLVYNNVVYSTLQEGFKVKDKQASYYYNNIFDVPSAVYPSLPTFSNNCYHSHSADVNDPFKVAADPKFVGPRPAGAGGDGYLATNIDRFKLQSSSPCINKGKSISNNGGRDFWNNSLYAGSYADIGTHEVTGGSAPPAPAVSFVDNTAAAVSYAGAWSHSSDGLYFNATRSSSGTMGSYVEFDFAGSNVSLHGKKGPANGRLNVQIDGGPSTLVDCYLPADKLRTELFHTAGLSPGAHTLRATIAAKNPASTNNGVAVDYFQTTASELPSPGIVATVDSAAGPGVTYSGTWTHLTSDSNFYGKTRSNSGAAGSYVQFSFTGTGARLLAAKASSLGRLNVSIDGGASTLVNCYNTTLPDYMVNVFEIDGLTNGPHVLRATVTSKDPASSGSEVAIDAFQSLVTPVTVDNPPSGMVVYSGSWTHSADPFFHNSTKSTSGVAGNSIQFNFTGSRVALFVKKGANLGRLNLSIDGGPVTTVNCYSATEVYKFKIHEFAGLPHGAHTLNVTTASKLSPSTGNYVGIDYFEFQP